MLSGAATIAGRIGRALRRFARDERGAVVVDQLPVLFLTMLIVLLIFEIGLAYFLNLGTAKAAQLGARVAVTLPAAHPDVPALNAPRSDDGEAGVWCAQPDGSDACVDPGGPWACDGASLGGCNTLVFDRIVADMRRSYPRLAPEDVVVTYAYRRLGIVGGDFVPEVRVTVRAQSYAFLTLVLSQVTGALAEKGPIVFAGASASAFGEHMNWGG
jgi:hypothetical protein